MNPQVNILVRTSNRPNYLHDCLQSIWNQTYPNIKVWLHSEGTCGFEENVDVCVINNCPTIRNNNKTYQDRGHTCKHAPYNLYLNTLSKMVDNGYIMYLDDDDMLASDDAIEKLASYMKDDKVILFDGAFGSKVLPTPKAINNLTNHQQTEIGTIGGRCFAFPYYKFNKKYYIEWDEFTCSDNRLINKLASWNFNDIIHVPILVTKAQSVVAGGGNKKDKAL